MAPEIVKKDTAGIITSAFGNRKYLEMALDLSLSVRNVSNVPISVVTNADGAMFFQKYEKFFDQILVDPDLNNVGNSNVFTAAKFASIRHSPYELSIFLDSDVFVRRDPSYLFELCDRNGFVVMGRKHDKHSIGKIKHHGLLVDDLFQELNIETYVHCFLCCFIFSKKGGIRIVKAMEEGVKEYNEMDVFCGSGINDELLIGLVGGECDFSYFPSEKPYQSQDYSFRWSDPVSFIHSAPMRQIELFKSIRQVFKARRKFNVPVVPTIFWVNELLKRRFEASGRSGGQLRFTQRIIQKLYVN